MSPFLVWLLALAASGATALGTTLTWHELGRAKALRASLEGLGDEADAFLPQLRAALASRAASEAPEMQPARPVLTPEDGPEPDSALEQAVARVRDPLAIRLALLSRWEAAAGVALADISPAPARFAHQHRELMDAQSMAQVSAAEMELEAAWPELLAALVARSDRDLDPLRAYDPLQRALDGLVRDLGFDWIDPERGEPAHPARHGSLGVFRRGTPAQRGTVGEVVMRGLCRKSEVLSKALIREFD